MRLLRPLAVALQLLTRLPVPLRDVDAEDLARSAGWFPVAGAVVGAILALVAALLAAAPWPPVVPGAIVVALAPLLTGGLHEDGLADTADGLGAGGSRERALAILRDSRMGAYGGLALVGAFGLRLAALLATDPSAWWAALIVAHGVSRLPSVLLMAALPYARADAERQGLASPMIAGMSPLDVLLAFALATALASGVGGPAGAAGLGLVCLGTVALGRWYRARLGGVTGDLLGAAVVVSEVLVLLSFAAFHPARISPWVAA